MANIVMSVLDMVTKMLQNNEPAEKILAFLNGSTQGIRSSVLREDIIACKACTLHQCNHTPFTGDIHSDIMFVGEAPGENEEKQGEPFVGLAGELFTRMVTVASEKLHPRWARENLYITNTIKCRPTDTKGSNRQPDLREVAACKQILDREIALVNPKVIICVGAIAANTLIHPDFKITQERGRFFGDQVKLISIYHPSYILRKGEDSEEGINLKTEVWQDLVLVNEYLNTLTK